MFAVFILRRGIGNYIRLRLSKPNSAAEPMALLCSDMEVDDGDAVLFTGGTRWGADSSISGEKIRAHQSHGYGQTTPEE
jgi:hypothetical protein